MHEVAELREVLQERDAAIAELESRLESLEADYCDLQTSYNHHQTRSQ